MTTSGKWRRWLITFALLFGAAICCLILWHSTQRLSINDDDMEIIRLVLADWIDDPDSIGVGCSERGDATLVVFSPTFAYCSGGQIRFDIEPRTIRDDVIQSFLLRNAGQIDLHGLRPSNAKIKVVDGSPEELSEGFEKCYPEAGGYVRISLPGYSAPADEALVRCSVGPVAMHGRACTYFLTKKQGVWAIQWKTVTQYD